MKMFISIVAAIVLSLTTFTHTPASAQQATEEKAAVATSPTTTDVRPPSIDPKSLIGEWIGQIVGRDSGTTIYFTFKKMEEDHVYGTFYIHAPWITGRSRYSNRDVPFVGTIKDGYIHIPGLPEFNLELGRMIQGKWETDDPNFQGVIRDLKKKG